MSPAGGPVSPHDLKHILVAIEDQPAFLIGGQALNIWAERYALTVPELLVFGPYTSKDVDFIGTRDVACAIAEATGGRLLEPTIDRCTPSTAIVEIPVTNGPGIMWVDFLDGVLGISKPDLDRGTQTIELVYAGGSLRLALLDPIGCLKSRWANVYHPALLRRDNNALRQLRASPIVAAAYLDELIDQGARQDLNRSIRQLHHWLRRDEIGRKAEQAVVDHGIMDPLDILRRLLDEPRLDSRFRSCQLTWMVADIEQMRSVASHMHS
ncbi:MAG TPA: hypothetical protein VNS22_16540 [Geminicoccus sp.]|uniref:hypothetical protein n=1 Tax=Geminicoccus sp. TaxID=2024832 RepID=UPI002B84DFE3|nr:hypothetical protein [Geminicoccus sp.]HWL69980.1 hypothetical protein [Geminicoccus sp.]